MPTSPETKQEVEGPKIENDSSFTPEQVEEIMRKAEELLEEHSGDKVGIRLIRIFDLAVNNQGEVVAPPECQVWTHTSRGPEFTFNITDKLGIYSQKEEDYYQMQEKK